MLFSSILTVFDIYGILKFRTIHQGLSYTTRISEHFGFKTDAYSGGLHLGMQKPLISCCCDSSCYIQYSMSLDGV